MKYPDNTSQKMNWKKTQIIRHYSSKTTRFVDPIPVLMEFAYSNNVSVNGLPIMLSIRIGRPVISVHVTSIYNINWVMDIAGL